MNALLVEFILILVSLITSAMVGGFLFGLFATYLPPPEVTAQVSSCSAGGGDVGCQLNLSNVGGHNVATTSCTLAVSGSALAATLTNGGVIPASGSLRGVSCTAQGTPPQPGSTLVGSIKLTNGVVLPFVGTIT